MGYGKLITTQDRTNKHAQHVGFGRRLMSKAEDIAIKAGYSKMAVISGVGARDYYRKKLGYTLKGDGQYMIKDIKNWKYYFYFYAYHSNYSRIALLILALVLFVRWTLTKQKTLIQLLKALKNIFGPKKVNL